MLAHSKNLISHKVPFLSWLALSLRSDKSLLVNEFSQLFMSQLLAISRAFSPLLEQLGLHPSPLLLLLLYLPHPTSPY